MSLSDYAYAPPPEEERRESAKPHMPPLSQVDRNLIAENRALFNANERLKQENQALNTSIYNTKRVVAFLSLACVVLIVLLLNVFNALHGANLRLSQLEGTVSAMQDRPMGTTGSATVTKPALPTAKTKPTATPKPAVMVYIPRSGKCYHDSEGCAGSDPTLVSLEEAKDRGYSRCGRCKPPI